MPGSLRGALAICALLFAAACEPTAHPPAQSAAEHDRPVPPSEPRAEVTLEVDLEPASDCEERFDLELYQDRRIDLIAWDDEDGCAERTIRIRYLSAKLDEREVIEAAREHALSAERSDSKVPTDGTGSPAPNDQEKP